MSITGFRLTWLTVLRQLKLIVMNLPGGIEVPQGSVLGPILE